MAKTQEELNQLKIEYEALNKKFAELTDEELKMVVGSGKRPGSGEAPCAYCGNLINVDDLSKHEQVCPMNPFNLQQMRGLGY